MGGGGIDNPNISSAKNWELVATTLVETSKLVDTGGSWWKLVDTSRNWWTPVKWWTLVETSKRVDTGGNWWTLVKTGGN